VDLPGGWTLNLNGTTRPEQSKAYLLFNATVGIDWSRSFPWTFDSNGWNVSLCISNSATQNYHVDISGESHAFEPTISWKPQSRSYDTLDIRKLLGAVTDSPTPRERGIYDLKLPSQQRALDTMSFVTDTISGTLYERFQMSDYRFGFDRTGDQFIKSLRQRPTIIFEESSHENALHSTHDAIFTHTLKETGNPALALQALNTVLTQIAYYDSLHRFDASSHAEYRMASLANISTKWTGFTIVMFLLAAHLIMVIVATVVFVFTTKHS
jgi:hypothetical protein